MSKAIPGGGRIKVDRRKVLRLSAAAGAALVTGGLRADDEDPAEEPLTVAHPDFAVRQFLKSMNCSQAVLEAFSRELGMPAALARRSAAGFAGGMGIGAECGALTGAIMVIGLKYGKTVDVDKEADEETFMRVKKLLTEFENRHGKIRCSDLLGVDMGKPEGVKEADEKGLFTSECPKFIRSACEILDEILA
jgi:C_GCAxxG_C_C family probable redox protein